MSTSVPEAPPRPPTNRVNVRIGSVGLLLLAASCWLFVRSSGNEHFGNAVLALSSIGASLVPASGYILGYALPNRRLIGWRVPAIVCACASALCLGWAASHELF